MPDDKLTPPDDMPADAEAEWEDDGERDEEEDEADGEWDEEDEEEDEAALSELEEFVRVAVLLLHGDCVLGPRHRRSLN